MEATVIKETVKGDRVFKGMSDGRVLVEDRSRKEYLGGCCRMTEGNASEDELAQMKERLLDDVCAEIRKIAKEHDDFFIIKTGEKCPGLDNMIVTTVAAKFILPTVTVND